MMLRTLHDNTKALMYVISERTGKKSYFFILNFYLFIERLKFVHNFIISRKELSFKIIE